MHIKEFYIIEIYIHSFHKHVWNNVLGIRDTG